MNIHDNGVKYSQWYISPYGTWSMPRWALTILSFSLPISHRCKSWCLQVTVSYLNRQPTHSQNVQAQQWLNDCYSHAAVLTWFNTQIVPLMSLFLFLSISFSFSVSLSGYFPFFFQRTPAAQSAFAPNFTNHDFKNKISFVFLPTFLYLSLFSC